MEKLSKVQGMKPLSEHQKKRLLNLYRKGYQGIQYAGNGMVGKYSSAEALTRKKPPLADRHGAKHYITDAGKAYAEKHYPNEIAKP
jgi:hypothetical protein